MADIELVDLTKHYKQGKTIVKALDGVSLRIDGGEFVSVVGRSGSGKTTLLDLVGLLLRPTAGSVLLDGQDTARLKDGQRADLRGQRTKALLRAMGWLTGGGGVRSAIATPDRAPAGGADRMSRRKDGRVLWDEPVERDAALVASSPAS